MTYLIENETAALLVPARFLARVHPHFREVMQLLAVQVADEARHVAFGVGHLQYAVALDSGLLARLASAAARRHHALARTAGLNEEVFDALVILAASGWEPDSIAAGFEKVQSLKREMAADHTNRLIKLGFDAAEAVAISDLHTRNFM